MRVKYRGTVIKPDGWYVERESASLSELKKWARETIKNGSLQIDKLIFGGFTILEYNIKNRRLHKTFDLEEVNKRLNPEFYR